MPKKTFLDSIDQIISQAKEEGLVHLFAEDSKIVDRSLSINGNKLINFGSCSYLGLETDRRIKRGVIDAVLKYGSQFSSSRAYLSVSPYAELQEKLEVIFDAGVIINPSTSAAHIGALPVLVSEDDVVILDHQVHASVQNAAQLLRVKGILVEMVRHNNMDHLEEKVKLIRQKIKGKIWYLMDGVYSMYGDFAPFDHLMRLLDLYEQLHLYIDDAHGMSWAGKHGRGLALSKISLDSRIILATSLNKAFAGSGGCVLFKDPEMLRKVKTCSAPYIYSGPIQPPMLGALLAAGNIHLSPEITVLQNELQEKISYTNKILTDRDIPLVVVNESPIFFIPAGVPKTGYNLVKRIFNEGFYVNVGLFPAVPIKNTGVRFTINRNHSKEQIDNLLDVITYHYPKALEEEGKTKSEIFQAFNIEGAGDSMETHSDGEIEVTIYRSIKQIDKTIWDRHVGKNAICTWEYLGLLENVFSDNPEKENNWQFYYFSVLNKEGDPILLTFFTLSRMKEDAFLHASISKQVEEKRKSDPEFLISDYLMMGSPLSEGDHLYINKSLPAWKDALVAFLKKLSKLKESLGVNTLLLRDFQDNDRNFSDLLYEFGYFKIPLHQSFDMEQLSWDNHNSFLSLLSARNRRHVRTEVFKFQDLFVREIISSPTPENIEEFYQLYLNVKQRSLEINTFTLPKKLFNHAFQLKNFELLFLKVRDEASPGKMVSAAAVLCFRNQEVFFPLIVGLDYTFLLSHGPYRQAIFQVLDRARELGCKKVCLGIGAPVEKRKFGTIEKENVGYMQVADHFAMDFLGQIAIDKNNSLAS